MTQAATVKTLLIVWHSLTGGAQQMARAAADGARSEAGVAVTLCRAVRCGPDDVLASMAGVMKDFFDRCYYPVLGRIEGRPYATLICAGSDGSGAARQIERICTGWRLKAIAPALIVCTHAQTPAAILAPKTIAPAELARCRELGQALAAGLALGVY